MPSTPPSSEEQLPEVDLQAQDVDGGEGEDGAGHDDARTGADGLDDDVLAQAALLAEGGGEADGEDGDRDGRFEDLADLEAQVGCGGGEDDGHQQAHRDGVGGDFGICLSGFEQGFVLFAGFEFAVGVLRQGDGFVLVHVFLFYLVNII